MEFLNFGNEEKLGGLGEYFPQMRSPIILTPKRHFLTRKHVV